MRVWQAGLALLFARTWARDNEPSIEIRQSNDAAPAALRIMALGASVTFGVGSSTGNSYRKDLRDMLASAGAQVSMVGSIKHGDFADNACEAYSGFVIDQLIAKANVATPEFKPNLILVDAGTNNCNKGGTFPDAAKNVSTMIQKMYQQSPGATVILTTILTNPDEKQDGCRRDINTQYQALAGDFQKQNAKFLLVDMRGSDGPTVNDLADKRHPNDVGYGKMAKVWMQGVQQAQSKGYLGTPSGSNVLIAGNITSPTTSVPAPVSTSLAVSAGASHGLGLLIGLSALFLNV